MAKAAVAKKPVPPAVEFFPEVEQQSQEWLELRLGTPTASRFSTIMASGEDGDDSKTRTKYLYQLAGEILTGVPAEGKIITAAMQRGNDMEPEARVLYERTNLVTVERVGFVRRKLPLGAWVGCSPDGLIGKRKALEIKTMAPDLMIALLEKGSRLPSKWRAQVHGTMWVGGFEECDLQLYYRGMPEAPKFTLMRDETFIKQISDAVEVFEYDLRQIVARRRGMGGKR